METENAELSEPTAQLHFVERNNRMILQQRIRIIDQTNGKVRYVWRDVPVERGEVDED